MLSAYPNKQLEQFLIDLVVWFDERCPRNDGTAEVFEERARKLREYFDL